MKKYLYLAAALLAASACTREQIIPEEPEIQVENGPVSVRLIAGGPQTRTELGYDEGVLKPYWSAGDVLGVTKVPASEGDSMNDPFPSTLQQASLEGAFEGKLYAGNNYFAYYPYTSQVGPTDDPESRYLAMVYNGDDSFVGYAFNVPVIQYPTPTSFDKNADLLISKPFNVEETTLGNVNIVQEINLEFTRVNAILKVVLDDRTSVNGQPGFLNNEKVYSVALKSEEPQFYPESRAVIEGIDNEISALSGWAGYALDPNKESGFSIDFNWNNENAVSAVYASVDDGGNGFYTIGAENQAAYFIVFPVTLKNGDWGDGLKLTVETENYRISRTISLPEEGIAIQPSRVTTLNIGLYDTSDPVHGQEMTIRRRGGIEFADPVMEDICLNLFDANNDLLFTEAEAAAVTSLGSDFVNAVHERNSSITSFDEFRYFTGITTIPEHTFEYCKNMTSIQIPENVTTIGIEAFDNCKNLQEIELPDGLTSIGAHAFYYCHGLHDVVIPESVTFIGGGAFYTCINLRNVYMQGTTPPTLGKNFWYNSQNERVTSDYNMVFYEVVNGNIIPNLYIWVKSNDVRDAFVANSEWAEYKDRIIVDK